MKRIIDISEAKYKALKDLNEINALGYFEELILNSTPLTECEAEDCIDREYTTKYVEEFANNEYVSEHEAETIYFIAEGIRHIPSVYPKSDKSVLEDIKAKIPYMARYESVDGQDLIMAYDMAMLIDSYISGKEQGENT